MLLDNKSLLQQLESACQELVLDLQEVALAHVHLERLVDDGEPCVVLDLGPLTVAVTHDTYNRISYLQDPFQDLKYLVIS